MAMTLSPGTYPTLRAERIEEPNRLWAIPLLGIVVKAILLIPVFIVFSVLAIVWLVLMVVNSIPVLFTGSYWHPAYDLTLGLIRLNTKIWFYLAGLTDKYPGFGLAIDDRYSLDIEYPEAPNRAFAIPILGGIVRWILLIPFYIYASVISYAAYVAAMISFVPVLFTGRYPETTFEIIRDAVRLGTAEFAYLGGLSDRYPSFAISTEHGTAKIFLIIIGALLSLLSIVPSIAGGR